MHRYYFFFNATATTEIYTLSLHDALPISATNSGFITTLYVVFVPFVARGFLKEKLSLMHWVCVTLAIRSEEHTSELQSHVNLVCRLLLEKKKYLLCALIYGHLSMILLLLH